jgi:hypothetical protein
MGDHVGSFMWDLILIISCSAESTNSNASLSMESEALLMSIKMAAEGKWLLGRL